MMMMMAAAAAATMLADAIALLNADRQANKFSSRQKGAIGGDFAREPFNCRPQLQVDAKSIKFSSVFVACSLLQHVIEQFEHKTTAFISLTLLLLGQRQK